jgi:hypothetical protein
MNRSGGRSERRGRSEPSSLGWPAAVAVEESFHFLCLVGAALLAVA